MSFDISSVIDARSAEREALYERHVNPQMSRVLRAIGFDRRWVQGCGAILVDSQGKEYLDTLSGWGSTPGRSRDRCMDIGEGIRNLFRFA